MKRCPDCRRDYYDDSLLYCLEDGTELVQGSVPSPDEPQTAILHETGAPSEAATRPQIHTTSAEPQSNVGEVSENPSPSQSKAAKLVLVVVVLALIAIGGFLGYRYFATTEQINSIAVMPFVHEKDQDGLEYISDGMTETLISSLSQLPNLSVKPRSSVFRYKGKEADAQSAGQELGVEAVLNGRVVQRDQDLSVFVELINVALDKVIWSKQYSGKQADLVSLQNEITRDISGKLKSKLSDSEERKVTKNLAVNPEAYQLYLKGRFVWNQRTVESLKKASVYYNQALEKDPNYALAYAGLAETYVLYPDYSVASPDESFPKAKAAAQRAMEIDDTLASSHAALGQYYSYYERDHAGAERELRRAIELDPSYATAHQWLGSELYYNKRFDEAIAEMRVAEQLDPLSPIIGVNLADSLLYAGRIDEAVAQYRKVVALDPNFAYGPIALAYGLIRQGKYEDAVAEIKKATGSSDDPYARANLARALAKLGRRDEAKEILNDLIADSNNRYIPQYLIAVVYGALGQKEEGMIWLEKEVQARGSNTTLFGVATEFDPFREDPRFKDMLKRLNLPE